jgi:hypothetical protein
LIRTRLRVWGGVLLALVCLAGAGRAQAQAPLELSVGDASAGWPPVVRVDGLLRDGALRRALQSGLPLRFHLRVELWEKGFFDRLAGAEESSLALVQDPLEGTYLLEDGDVQRRFATLAEVEDAVGASFRVALRPRERGRFYYLGSLEVETLSLSDLEELRRWLRGEVRPAVEGRSSAGKALERGLRRVFVRVIGLPTRRYEARSRTFEPR